jgi:hypothetical protein
VNHEARPSASEFFNSLLDGHLARLGGIKNGARSRLIAPEFADHEAQVFSMSMSKLRDNACRLS